MEKIYNFINGEFLLPSSNKYIEVIEPATGIPYAEVPDSNYKDIDQAINYASEAFISWSKTTIEKRSKILNQIARGIDLHADRLADQVAFCSEVVLPRAIPLSQKASMFSIPRSKPSGKASNNLVSQPV